MREIKIKYYFKNKLNEKEIQNYIYDDIDNMYIWDHIYELNLDWWDFKVLDRCLFTWFLDKNWTEIYEGDIVEYLDASWFSLEDVWINRWIVELDLCEGINFTNRDSVDMEDIDFEEVEIIGNIYENTELLNK